MKVNIDDMGPWVHNKELKNKIESQGISGEIIPRADPKHNTWSDDLRVLHIPTGKVNGYSAYYELNSIEPYLTIFNGLYQEIVEHDLSEFKYIYEYLD